MVDASVAIEWFLPEPHSNQASKLQQYQAELHAPDFIDVELAAIVWKKIRREGLLRSDADLILAESRTLIRHSKNSLLNDSFDLADRTDRTDYDSIYLSLAIQVGGVMVTSDERLFNALASTNLTNDLVLVSQLT